MSETPAITLIVPTMNRADFIGRALGSLMEQTHEDFEVLVVDDSRDLETKSVVESFRESRFRYHRPTERQGFYRTCRYALDLCSSSIVGFMGDDDQVTPNYLETLHEGLLRPKVVASYARSPWAAEGQPPFRISQPNAQVEEGGPWGFLAHLRQPAGARLARMWGLFDKVPMAEALELSYLPDIGKPTLGRDFLIFFYLCMKGRIAYSEEAEYRFLYHPKQVGRDRSELRLGIFPQGRFNIADNLVGYSYMIDRVLEELDQMDVNMTLPDKVLFSYCLWAWLTVSIQGMNASVLTDHAQVLRQLGLGQVTDTIADATKSFAEAPIAHLEVDRPSFHSA